MELRNGILIVFFFGLGLYCVKINYRCVCYGEKVAGFLAPTSTPNFMSGSGSIMVWWTYNSSANTFRMTVKGPLVKFRSFIGKTNGYISVGFSDAQYMEISDTITGWVQNTSPYATVLIDEISQNYNQPVDDRQVGGTHDVYDIQGEQVNYMG